MKIPFTDLKRQFEDLLISASSMVEETVKSNQFILGEQVNQFEDHFARYLQVKHCITCGNGTDALELALEVLNIGPGDEVILPGFGWVSPFTAVKRRGGIPVAVDVDSKTGNISLEHIRLAAGKDTKAIIVIHLFGTPCDIEAIRHFCDDFDLHLIEDCAQAHGATCHGQRLGSFGDLSIFSFYPTKNLGALGDAGAVCTNSSTLAGRVRSLRDYGRVSRSEFSEIGRNSRMDEFQARFLNEKLKVLDKWNERRRKIAKSYSESIEVPLSEEFNSVFYQFPLKVSERKAFQEAMKKAGIGTEIHYSYTVPGAFGASDDHLPCAGKLSELLVSIPIYPQLTDEEISYICDHLKRNQDLIV